MQPKPGMRADASLAMSPSSLKANMSHLRLSLQEVKESEDEEEAARSSCPTKGAPTVTSAWTQPAQGINGDVPERPQSSKMKKRPQSAKRPQQNGHATTRSDSPLSSKSPSSPHRPAPPKSAPSLKPRGPSKGRTVKSRERNGTGDSAEPRTSSPSPQRPQVARPETAAASARGSHRQPRRRLHSRSEDRSCSCGDPQSPRLSVNDQQQLSLNGTLSPEGSDELKHPSVPGSPGGARGHPASQASPWDVFEEHLRTIHDSSDLYSRYQGPSFQASSTFQETMVELYGYPDYSHPPGPSVHHIASRGMVVAGAASRFLRLRKRSVLNAQAAGKGRVVDRQTVENAKRGWRVLKQYVHDNFISKRTSQAALSWSMLRHTLKGLSDREKTRLDLYRRYGIVPSVDQEGNVVMVNTMLSERARQAIANGSRHPLLTHGGKTFPPSQDRTLSLPPAVSSSSLWSPRSSTDNSATQRQGRSSTIRSARAEVRPRSSVSGTRSGGGSGGGVPLRNGTPRKSSELMTRSPTRSHTH